MVSEPLQKTFLREKSELKLREKEEVKHLLRRTLLSIGLLLTSSIYCVYFQEKVEGSRRLTTVISPGREVADFTKVVKLIVTIKEMCFMFYIFRREGSRE